MKKLLGIIVSTFILFISIIPVSANSNRFENLSMTVDIQQDGSAIIDETWRMYVAEGTESYKVYNNMGDAYITDFTVSDQNGDFVEEPNWNIKASREEKTGKYGIVTTSDGYELCFGVGEYGYHVYHMSYRIVNFVDQYADKQAINYQLVSSNLNPMPEQVEITIQTFVPFSSENAEIYAFGFIGDINFQEDGSIFVSNNRNEQGYGDINYVNVLIGLKGISYSSANTLYSDQTYQDILSEAKEGSNYGGGHGGDDYFAAPFDMSIVLPILLITAILFVATIIIVIIIMKRIKEHFPNKITIQGDTDPLPKKAEVPPFRDIPVQKNIFRFYYIAKLARLGTDAELKSGLISAVLLSWIRSGYLEFVKVRGNILNRKKYEIDFSKEVLCQNELEEQLLGYFKAAAGSNVILEAKEFEGWCKKHYNKIDAWFTRVDFQESKSLREEGYVIHEEETHTFLGFKYINKKEKYTYKFKELLFQVTGFKNFLLEFSSIEEKQVQEVRLWEEYLIFASILGLAENVETEIGRLYPEFNQQSHIDVTYTTIYTRMFIYSSVRSAHNAKAAEEMRSSGGGGGSSFGGGGGSFHGGGGGGIR